MVAFEGIDTSRFWNFSSWPNRICHQLKIFPSSSNPDLISPICSISYRLYTTNNSCRREPFIGPIDNKTWRKCNEESLCFMPQSLCINFQWRGEGVIYWVTCIFTRILIFGSKRVLVQSIVSSQIFYYHFIINWQFFKADYSSIFTGGSFWLYAFINTPMLCLAIFLSFFRNTFR